MDHTVDSITPASPSLAAIARRYVGQREKPGNSGFHDANFERSMQFNGWRKGLSWCAFFVRLCVREASLRDLTSPSAVATFRAYAKAGLTGREPRPDSIAVWQKFSDGKATVFGHVGIVEKVAVPLENGVQTFACIEGNTDGSGGREGDGVYVKTRKVSFAPVRNGLVLLGFCYPPKATE
jgi:hypothetical protein